MNYDKKSCGAIESNEKVEIHSVNLKETLMILAEKNEMSFKELAEYLPPPLIKLLENRKFLDAGELRHFCIPVPEAGPNKCHVYGSRMYSLTLKGVELTNNLENAPVTVRIYSKGTSYESPKKFNLSGEITAKGLGFGYSRVLMDELLEEILDSYKKKV